LAAHLEHAERFTTFQDDLGDLVRVLGRLRLRLGLERILVFGLHGAVASALGSIGLSLAAWLVPIGNWQEMAWIIALPLLAALGLALLRWPSDRQAALAADRRLALDERLGTAVELAGRLRVRHDAAGRFDRLQVRDAVARTRAARGGWLALERKMRREAVLAAALTLLAAVSLVLPGLPRPGLPVANTTAAMTGVGPPGAAVSEGRDPALAELTRIDTRPIQQVGDPDLAARVQQQQAERQVLDSLAQAVGGISAGQSAADAIQRDDFPAARDQLSTLGEEADQLSDAAKQELSRALQQAANASAATDKQLSDRERQAAQALSRSSYADQRQALRNLADQVEKSGARTTSADQLARDVGRMQQQAASQAQGAQGRSQQATGADGAQSLASQQASGNAEQAGASAAGQAGAGAGAAAAGQQGGPGMGSGTNPDVLGDQPSRLDTAGERVDVPAKLGNGPGVRPADGTEDQTGSDPTLAPHSVSELVQSQQTGQVAPEQNLVPGEQRPVVRGYFR
jgi:hypothetical protein